MIDKVEKNVFEKILEPVTNGDKRIRSGGGFL